MRRAVEQDCNVLYFSMASISRPKMPGRRTYEPVCFLCASPLLVRNRTRTNEAIPSSSPPGHHRQVSPISIHVYPRRPRAIISCTAGDPTRGTRQSHSPFNASSPSPRVPGRMIVKSLRTMLPILVGIVAGGLLLRNAPTLYGNLALLPPWLAMTIVAAINFVSVVLCFPANMGLMITAGAVLGPRNALIALYLSKLLAASFAFLLARGVLYQSAKAKLESFPKLKRVLMNASKQQGTTMVLLMRLSPFPGFMLNYLLSLTGVSLASYFVGTAVGILPSIVNLVLIGGAARDVSIGAASGGVDMLKLGIRLLCIASSLLTMFFVTRSVKKAFAEDDVDMDAV